MSSGGKTISEKILSAKSGQDARAGDFVICRVDGVLGTDAAGPMAIDYFTQMAADSVFDPAAIVFALDHYAPPPTAKAAAHHDTVRDFCRRHGIKVFDVGAGIGHQLIVETGRALPGGLVVGADSHAVTYGALNCFATGIGSSDLAAAMMSGAIWLKVPASFKVTLNGRLPPGVYPKDIALALVGILGADGATYQALEFHGPAIADLSLEDRLVLSNMSMEAGAKNGIFPADAVTTAYLAGRTEAAYTAVAPDADAVYDREIHLDISMLMPQVALPHLVDQVVGIDAAAGTPVQMVYLGTCTGGRVGDFHQALAVLTAGGGPATGVQVVVTPASADVRTALAADGTLAAFEAFGALIQPPGCGACCGSCGLLPGDGVNVISTANRNFKGRMGNPAANIYLASPAACAAAAVRGQIADPRELDTV